ncbi:MAG TPA: hypothetical protein VGO45_08320 [Bacteroidia bacterium]|nr:hypothetical protein [Bacteroidia bacterium]
MKKKSLFLTVSALLALGGISCKKCSTCTSTDNAGHLIKTEKYCSTSGTNLDTFEKSFKTTYGYNCVCTRQ